MTSSTKRRNGFYEVWNRAVFSGELHSWNTTPKVLASAMQHDFPEVEHAIRVNWPSNYLFSVGEKKADGEREYRGLRVFAGIQFSRC